MAQGHVKQVMAQVGCEGVRGAAKRVGMEGTNQPRYQVGEGAHCQHSASGHIGDLLDNVRSALTHAYADAILSDKRGVVLVGAAVADLAGEGLQAREVGPVLRLVGACADGYGVVEAFVHDLGTLGLHNDVPPPRRTSHRDHGGFEGDMPCQVKLLHVLPEVLFVLCVVPVVTVACGRHVREGHEVIADGQNRVVVHAILLRIMEKYAALFALPVEALHISDALIFQLLDCGQACGPGAYDAHTGSLHGTCT
mmetsp:Transcript_143129/g.398824  ORF Transcript_143129/g.398824 Transcript_143129/m.398824 type:complete len:252 (-) Transcript_143129:27-782(-)